MSFSFNFPTRRERICSCLASSAKIKNTAELGKNKRPEFHISMCKPLSLFIHKGLVAALYHIYFFFIYIHSYINSFVTFAEAPFHIFTAAGSVGGTPLGVQAQIRTRAFSTALCHMSYATSHLMWATYAAPFMSNAAPFRLHWTRYELRCTLYEIRCIMYEINCTVYELRCILYELRCTIYELRCTQYDLRHTLYEQSNAAPYELRCTLRTYATPHPIWATLHPISCIAPYELRFTLQYMSTLYLRYISYVAPYLINAAPYSMSNAASYELRCILWVTPDPIWAMLHPIWATLHPIWAMLIPLSYAVPCRFIHKPIMNRAPNHYTLFNSRETFELKSI
jgi:hypothetical protein